MNILTNTVQRAEKNAHMGRMPRTKEVQISGKKFTLYSIGWLAVLVAKHPHTIRQYERRKVLPPPILTTKSKQRWYLAEEISGYASILKSTQFRPNVNIEEMGLQTSLYNFRNVLKNKFAGNIHAIQAELKGEKGLHDYAQGMKAALIRKAVAKKFPNV